MSGNTKEDEDVARAIENSLKGEDVEIQELEAALLRSREELNGSSQAVNEASQAQFSMAPQSYVSHENHVGDTINGDSWSDDDRSSSSPSEPSVCQPSHASASAPAATDSILPADKPGIEDMIAELQQSICMGLPRLNDANSDTLVYIDSPARPPNLKNSTWRDVVKHYSEPFRMRSKALKDTGSPFIERLLGPTAQYRFKRRHDLRGGQGLPNGIKYVLDLTPPTEGYEALNLILDLSCSEGVRKWGLARKRWNIAQTLVSGKDEFTDNAADADNVTKPVTRSELSQTSDLECISKDEIDYEVPEDYTPLRHRLAIERVLMAISGKDPKLDSAPKVWTTFAVAKNFGIRQSLLTDYIIRWLRAPPNTLFLEVLPEVALQIADGLQCQSLCRDAFAILVGEAALTASCQGRDFPAGHNVHGRKLGYLPEGYLTRVQYAKDIFRERMENQFHVLAGHEMRWIEEIPELRQLSRKMLNNTEHKRAITALVQVLKRYVQGSIYHLLCLNYDNMPGPVMDRGGASDLFPNTKFRVTWKKLLYRDRYLTLSFWKLMRGCRLRTWDTNFAIEPEESYGKPSQTTIEAQQLQEAGIYSRVTYREVREKIEECRMLSDRTPISSFAELSLAQNSALNSGKTLSDVESSTASPSKKRPFLQDTESLTLPMYVPIRPAQSRDGNEAWATGSDHKRRLSASLRPRGENGSGNDSRSPPPTTTWTIEEGNALRPPESMEDLPTWQELGQESTTLPIRFRAPTDPKDTAAAAADNPCQPATDPSRREQTELYSRVASRAFLKGRTVEEANPTRNSIPFQRLPIIHDVRKDANLTSPHEDQFFSLLRFLSQVEKHIHDFAYKMLDSPDKFSRDALYLEVTDTLVCLSDEELKYLPLWAGGNDDGSGGVYNDNVPIADVGFSTAGPGVHTGVSSSVASSEFEMIGSEGSTVRSSTIVNDGYSDTMDRRRTYDADSMWGDVMASKAKAEISGASVDADVTMDSESTWERVATPTTSENGDSPMEDIEEAPKRDIKGKGKITTDDDMYDDVFQENDNDEEAFDFGSDDGMGEFEDAHNDTTTYNHQMSSKDANATIIYRGGDEEDERP